MERKVRRQEIRQAVFQKEWEAFSRLFNDFNSEKVAYIERAFFHSFCAHYGQKRKNGEMFIKHPEGVTKILVEAGVRDHIIICAALLHDVVEDTHYLIRLNGKSDPKVSQYDVIKSLFPEDENQELPAIIYELTKSERKGIKKEKADEMYFRSFSAISTRAMLVKMADIIHNLPTFYVHSEKKQRKKRKQITEVYLPVFQEKRTEYSAEQAVLLERLHKELGIRKETTQVKRRNNLRF